MSEKLDGIVIGGTEYELGGSGGGGNVDVLDDESQDTLNITDERGYSIAQFKDGHLKTKEFDSRNNSKPASFFDLFLEKYCDNEGNIIKLNTGQSLVSTIHSWGFIGGSTASGEIEYTEGGSTHFVDLYDYSIGQRLCKLNSVDCYNFSNGGQYAKGWCKTTSGQRGWGFAQQSENYKQAYAIDLGANDVSHLTTYYPGGIGNVETDIDWDNYNNNADTFVGWYIGLIQRLRSIVPNCYIFIFTSRVYMYPESSSYTQLAKPAIISIFNKLIAMGYKRVYFVDNNSKGLPDNVAIKKYILNGSHPSVIGYQVEAFILNTLFDWTIRQNLEDFKETCFAIDGRHRQ